MRLGGLSNLDKKKYFTPAHSLVITVIVMPANLDACIHFISQIKNLLILLTIKYVNNTHTPYIQKDNST